MQRSRRELDDGDHLALANQVDEPWSALAHDALKAFAVVEGREVERHLDEAATRIDPAGEHVALHPPRGARGGGERKRAAA